MGNARGCNEVAKRLQGVAMRLHVGLVASGLQVCCNQVGNGLPVCCNDF